MRRPPLPRLGLSCSALLAALCSACGGGIEAAAARPQRPAAREIPPEVRSERARLSDEVRQHRRLLSELGAEQQDLQQRLAALGTDELSGPQAGQWKSRLSLVREEIRAHRASLNEGLDAIARLSESF